MTFRHGVTAAAIGAMGLLAPLEAFTNSGGAPPGRTGSPAENGNTCNASGCHSGSAVNSGSGSITVSGPTSYLPGQDLELLVTVADEGAQRIGFQISVLDAANQRVGNLLILDAANTRFADTGQFYVTHNGAPFDMSTRTFRVGWRAPASEVGPVTFYMAGNAANGNGASTGDLIYTSTYEVSVGSGTGTEPGVLPAHFTVESLYPNPVMDEGSLVVTLASATSLSVRVVDMLGRTRASQRFESLPSGLSELKLALSGLPTGTYLAVLETDGGDMTSRRISVVR